MAGLKQRMPKLDRQGLTLPELMISLVIFGIVMGVVFSFMVGTRNSYTETRARAHYQQSLRAVISLLTKEVRSTGCDPQSIGFDRFGVAATNQLRCRADLNGDSDITDVSPDEDVIYTFNAGTGELSRDNGTGAQVILRGVQNVTFSYFDDDENLLGPLPLNATDRQQINYVDINIAGETDHGEPVNYQTRILVRNG